MFKIGLRPYIPCMALDGIFFTPAEPDALFMTTSP